jgi:phenylalanyl-tRNA synthetase alpha chain
MDEVSMDLEEPYALLRREAEATLSAAGTREQIRNWYADFLGRKGRLTEALRDLGKLPKDQRPRVGQLVNSIKVDLERVFHEHQDKVEQAEIRARLANNAVDVTLPGSTPGLGKLHPTTRTLREIYAILGQMGFQVSDYREVESDDYNFDLLNIPSTHPARDMWDTFYTQTPSALLRTHTSPGQIHAMRAQAPRPIRVILPGKCYRREDVTARSEWMFYQVEGLAVGTNITFGDLKGVLQNFARQMFGKERELRFRKSFFPFTEPSVEVDVSCGLCDSRGCRLCKHSGWLEILGAGMVHPRVLANGGYDPRVCSGFAFGMGPERITMLKYGIDDIRYFFSNDVRFLRRMP